MHIDDICIILKKSNNKFDDQMEFFENNYNKVFLTMGDKENKMYYDSLSNFFLNGPLITTLISTWPFLPHGWTQGAHAVGRHCQRGTKALRRGDPRRDAASVEFNLCEHTITHTGNKHAALRFAHSVL